ncbi:MAG: hypothetical protein WCJ72_01695 [Chryseobacterium sp.]|jgi:hypothetical protein
MEKIFAVISVARQVEGEYIVLKPEKAFRESNKAEQYANKLAKIYTESIQTPTGPVQCLCTRGVFELEIEE